MAEPRARPRTKGQVFSTPDLTDLLYAYGDQIRTPSTPTPLSATVTALDEILTDFIIETCHSAALSASYSRRQKIKVDDFKFVLRHDEVLLGRVLEQLWRDKRMKEERKLVDFDKVGASEGVGVAELEGIAQAGGVGKEVLKKRKKRRRAEGEEGERPGKRVAS